jgi:hypothetical protein
MQQKLREKDIPVAANDMAGFNFNGPIRKKQILREKDISANDMPGLNFKGPIRKQ